MYNAYFLLDSYAHSVYNSIRKEVQKMRARELEKILLEDGWYIKNQKGSHRQYKHPSKPGKVTIPFHNGDVDKGTADSILKQAGLK